MSVSFSAGTGLLLVGIFLLLLIIPGFTDIISDLSNRQVRSIWRHSTKYSLAIIGIFLVSIGLFIILKTEVPEGPTQAQVLTEILSPSPPTQVQLLTKTLRPSPPTKWYVRVYNVDNRGTAYVNGTQVVDVSDSQDSGWVDVTTYFSSSDANNVRFTLWNDDLGYVWGFALKRDNDIIWQDEQGKVGVGANNNDQSKTNQFVYDKTLSITNEGIVTTVEP